MTEKSMQHQRDSKGRIVSITPKPTKKKTKHINLPFVSVISSLLIISVACLGYLVLAGQSNIQKPAATVIQQTTSKETTDESQTLAEPSLVIIE